MLSNLGNMSAIKGSCHLKDGRLLVELKSVNIDGQNRAVGFLFDEHGKCYIIPILDGQQLPSNQVDIIQAISALVDLDISTTNVINDNSNGEKGEPLERYLSIVPPEELQNVSLESVIQTLNGKKQDKDDEEIHRGISPERMAMN